MRHGDAPRQVQPEPESLRAGAWHKAFEEPRHDLDGYPRTLVADLEQPARALNPSADPASRAVRFPAVVVPSVAFGKAADEVQPRADWREVVSQTVRQHGDQVLCHGPATLLDCVPRSLLRQFGVASDNPHRARDEL